MPRKQRSLAASVARERCLERSTGHPDWYEQQACKIWGVSVLDALNAVLLRDAVCMGMQQRSRLSSVSAMAQAKARNAQKLEEAFGRG